MGIEEESLKGYIVGERKKVLRAIGGEGRECKQKRKEIGSEKEEQKEERGNDKYIDNEGRGRKSEG